MRYWNVIASPQKNIHTQYTIYNKFHPFKIFFKHESLTQNIRKLDMSAKLNFSISHCKML